VEDAIRSRGLGEVPSHEVGLAILGPLRALDEVAYLRFASVYRGFESLADFEAEITALRAKRDETWRAAVEELDRDDADSERGDDARKAVTWQSAGAKGT
jgi:transcriptional repressor NrdR